MRSAEEAETHPVLAANELPTYVVYTDCKIPKLRLKTSRGILIPKLLGGCVRCKVEVRMPILPASGFLHLLMQRMTAQRTIESQQVLDTSP